MGRRVTRECAHGVRTGSTRAGPGDRESPAGGGARRAGAGPGEGECTQKW